MNYAKAVRVARSIADISQAELSERSGVDRSYLSLIESDKRKASLATLEKISTALGLPFHLLTLLATEKQDASRIDQEQLNSLAKQLTQLLLERYDPNSGINQAAFKFERSGVQARSKTGSSARSRSQ